MIDILKARLLQKKRTVAYPKGVPVLPDRFRGLPKIDHGLCQSDCRVCETVCPVKAIRKKEKVEMDLGRCLFCLDCLEACPKKAISFTTDHQLAANSRAALVYTEGEYQRAEAAGKEIRRLFGRSLKLRQVSAGGCNACEADINVLTTVVFDLGRFGIQIVAAPRHADGLLITGPVSRNMEVALRKTYDAIPSPKIVIAVGACAISGGPFIGHPEVLGGSESVVPVDLYIPGCPPHPLTILDGLLRFLGKRVPV